MYKTCIIFKANTTMSIAQVIEACKLHAIFVKLGYLFRARVCLNIALVNLQQLRQRVPIPQVAKMLIERETHCCLLLKELNNKIYNRILIKLYKVYK
ncbi:hypothetical protein [Choristoneura rosaceana nucleopolyhedrovirus]|uniref:Uncharacterized protein n=1 Tax=Choristoneura rosaceana nucleopolyhedrovirus TaxID=58094 RepID=S5MR83_9ABAC|nr:hypothetical protein [Choristoneura rosaceana nucleopolyhedrovirus]AGR57074.1 hypothetical protein [Choristoneura rosaceana nucleopolyhedrovirus]